MKIQYLGTAAAEAIPSPFCYCRVCERARKEKGKEIRTRSQAVIDDRIVMDYPCDSFDHMIRFGLDMRKVEHVFLTHSHDDHFYPADLILKRPDVAAGLRGMLHIYGNETNFEKYDMAVKREHRPLNSFTDYQSYHIIHAFQQLSAGAYQITPLSANHDVREECLLYLISDGEKTLFYGNDSGLFPEETWRYLEGVYLNAVSLDSTMLKLPQVFNHMNLSDVLYVKKRLTEMGTADENTVFVLTHFSHNGGMTHEEIEAFGKENGFLVAYDGMCVKI